MKFRAILLFAASALSAVPLLAQDAPTAKGPPIEIQYFRARDQRGLNIFETPKYDTVTYKGFRITWGAAFTQQFQALRHSNRAEPKMTPDPKGEYNANELMKMGSGANPASANLYLDVQLADGIRVALTTYLSSRHHTETWVKDGYLLIDGSPIKWEPLENLMNFVTVKAGHFEINYGDAHFRRTDNGQAIYNPFVGNYILDAFTTEVGGEVYFRLGGFMLMGGVTGAEIKGNVLQPEQRSPAFLSKIAFDHRFGADLRFRLSASRYSNSKSPANTLFAGDRSGSRYFYVLENTKATSSAQFRSGLIDPGFKNEVSAYQINPFVKLRGLELFGVVERATGKATTETTRRTWDQRAVDAVYRFLPGEPLYVGARFNTVSGELPGMPDKVTIDRRQFGAGWFMTPNILLKGEYVRSNYRNFPVNDIRHGGMFNGFVIEGVVAF